MADEHITPELICDISKTLFGLDAPADTMPADHPEIFFASGHRFELFFGFVEEGSDGSQIFRLELSLPIGKIVADAEAWEGLKARMALHVSEVTGKIYRAMSWAELTEFARKREERAAAQYFFANNGTVGEA
jgi:hypothetical protein